VRENVGHHRVWFPDTEAISETWDVFFDLLDRVEFGDQDPDEESVAPTPLFTRPAATPETHAESVVDLVETVPVDTVQDFDLNDDDEDNVASPSSRLFSMSTAQPPSPSFVSPSGSPSGGGLLEELLEELEGQECERDREGK
jgi:hypothetical protein